MFLWPKSHPTHESLVYSFLNRHEGQEYSFLVLAHKKRRSHKACPPVRYHEELLFCVFLFYFSRAAPQTLHMNDQCESFQTNIGSKFSSSYHQTTSMKAFLLFLDFNLRLPVLDTTHECSALSFPKRHTGVKSQFLSCASEHELRHLFLLRKTTGCHKMLLLDFSVSTIHPGLRPRGHGKALHGF